MLDDLLTADALAARLGLSRQSLAVWRLNGSGPPFYKAGSRVLYRTADVEAWLESRRRTSTSARANDDKMD